MEDAMNATPSHPKVKVSLKLADPAFIAGGFVAGKMEMECRADKGLAISVMMVELFAIQELTSRDHTASSTFLHSRRLFQGPGLPPSNAVQSHPLPGDPPLPRGYHQALRGLTTFLFRFPLPPSSPSSISFGSGLARIRYELKSSVGVFWKGDKRLVTSKREVEVLEILEEDFTRVEPEGVVVGENGKIWVQGKVVGGILISGESACVELMVKNHSARKNNGLSITLTRSLHLQEAPKSVTQQAPLQISDTLTTVAFSGPEYVIPPGAEGVASLVFDVPKHARGAKGGTREGAEGENRLTEALFEVRCNVGIKIAMGIGSKDIHLDLPVVIVHPSAIPLPLPAELQHPRITPVPQTLFQPPLMPYSDSYGYPGLMNPPYLDQGQVWFPPPVAIPTALHPHQYFLPPLSQPQYPAQPQRSQSAEMRSSGAPLPGVPSSAHFGVPVFPSGGLPRALTVGSDLYAHAAGANDAALPHESKGERASRISQHLRNTSRHRSASPQFRRPHPHTLPAPLQTPQFPEPIVQPQARVSLSPAHSGIVHSPRPILTPKHSRTFDTLTNHSLPRSERVEELERMADEVGKQSKDLSGDLPKVPASSGDGVVNIEGLKSDIDKTLPPPPPPSGKQRESNTPSGRGILGEDVFSPPPNPTPAPAEATPPTPLNAVTPMKRPRPGLLTTIQTESGLDRLERQLVADVGTRKPDRSDRRADVRAVLPIDIPLPNKSSSAGPQSYLVDSAISSLSLADHEIDEDERTHKPPKSSASGEDRHGRGHDRKSGGSHKANGREKADRKERTKDRDKDGTKDREKEAQRRRRNAKGRVAAWLGGLDVDALPASAPPVPPLSAIVPETEAAPIDPTSPSPLDDMAQKDVWAAPNPRSSGFVPIGTYKREPLTRQSAKPPEVGAIFSQADPITSRSPPGAGPSAANMQDAIADSPQIGDEVTNFEERRSPPQLQRIRPPPLSAFPPSLQDPGIKYDVRSARGGRGGKVTAVASIWASGAIQSGAKPNDLTTTPPKPLRPAAGSPLGAVKPTGRPLVAEPAIQKEADKSPKVLGQSVAEYPPSSNPISSEAKLVEFKGKQLRPIIKSSSVPAIISSSHATPTLSSTASLARPPVSPHQRQSMPRVGQSSTAPHPPVEKAVNKPTAAKTSSTGSLAFGQARLRELIKKYQGESS